MIKRYEHTQVGYLMIVAMAAAMVLIVVIIVGIFLGLIDFGFAKVVNGLFLGR